VLFDIKSIRDVFRLSPDVVLTLGYNTASFSVFHRIYRLRNIINMDGLEWKRQKWNAYQRAWLWINERLGCWLANHLIADHPEIKAHLSTRVSPDKITMIPYGALEIANADVSLLSGLGVEPQRYAVVIARPEPENSILEIVQAFSAKVRGFNLVLLGNFDGQHNPYHTRIVAAASPEVRFVGAIYDPEIVAALRFHARLYIHGHRVGGTNPSLVEALGASSPILAHDNRFNRWVAGAGAQYFEDEKSCGDALDLLLSPDFDPAAMRTSSRRRFHESFEWDNILGQYECLLERWARQA
jgi:glycosyltransferase involved in cell wall biosynthesis